VALYDSDRAIAARSCVDRLTGEPIDHSALKTYADVLGPFQFRPEHKMLNARPRDSGVTERRHIVVDKVERIGKETNMYEEQQAWGYNPADDPVYSPAPDDTEWLLDRARADRKELGSGRIADRAGIEPSKLSRILNAKRSPIRGLLQQAVASADELRVEQRRRQERAEQLVELLLRVKSERGITVAALASELGVGSSTLSWILSGKRLPNPKLLEAMARLCDASGA
jgi:transcriptional regulator with XRE-family HTH domain